MDIVVKGRNVEVPDHYRELVEEKIESKIAKYLARYDGEAIDIDVELYHEPNPRQNDHAQRVEITCRPKGAVMRAEACAGDFRSAFELAVTKLGHQLRKNSDRKRVHRGGTKAPMSVAEATANGRGAAKGALLLEERGANGSTAEARFISEDVDHFDGLVEDHLPGRIVREKIHPGEPMTVDDALQNMELVGHDFYLFHDKESGRPSVVYRRRAFDYGLLRLDL
ncbi:ribosome-associated translation inhibitor RaiA [Glycomyces sp. TRM65418]|uniref:ribosome hibernation-promoting factor, HPF/YfiA family n=1 Tax=Glycomyces sp. TRM65418 TaxID=2867006 RepID=UPI001CE602CF|nr:ribosome-associated translation inhibitor RaiA [Glycomyces sp. TRM65418]MCC3762837.1 ribosome-associated translation inhibitor RaiA [Glycomyces sp. TRM65418]QZD56864.1 ribosome-associated translation inhibitor RaiA [Glycomyces sp. TRM65418]